MEFFFKTALLQCFDDKQDLVESFHQETPGDDWANVSMDNTTGKPTVGNRPQLSSFAVTKLGFYVLPDARTLPRPDDLFLKPPYYLAIYGGSQTAVEVQYSHSPTLELLSDYLKKRCNINNQDSRRPPAAEINLHQSPFGFGLTYDRLTMSVENRNPYFLVSPIIILSFVEGVLGYKSVSVEASSWVFRRDVELRKSR
ncbi:hypothetical protein AAE478_010605 [Parahypoxylon ruwenzoriense]